MPSDPFLHYRRSYGQAARAATVIAPTMCVVPLGTVRSSPNCSKAFAMTTQDRALNPWTKLPISLRAIISGLLIALAAANVWPLLLLNLGVPLAAFAEAIFLALYLWWAGGGGPPRTTKPPAPRRSGAADCRPRNGLGALSPRSSSPP